MSDIDDGGPAFPCEQHETTEGTWNQTFESGMSLRDWFAGQALAGLYAAQIHGLNFDHAQVFAGIAYDAADAMLGARKKGR